MLWQVGVTTAAMVFCLQSILFHIKNKNQRRDFPWFSLMVLLYLFFNAVVVNYRPVLLEETMEASFPSSHTVLAIVVFATAIIQVRRRLPEGQTKQIVIYVFYALLVILIVGRILSGVHWFTDICGGVLLGFALTYLYQGLLESFEGSSGKHAK